MTSMNGSTNKTIEKNIKRSREVNFSFDANFINFHALLFGSLLHESTTFASGLAQMHNLDFIIRIVNESFAVDAVYIECEGFLA